MEGLLAGRRAGPPEVQMRPGMASELLRELAPRL